MDNITHSLQDNRSFMPRASLDKLRVSIVSSDTGVSRVLIEVEPQIFNEADSLTVASATALIASRAILGWYPAAPAVQVHVLGEFTDRFGKTSTDDAAWLQIGKSTAAQFDYNGLRDRVESDNKLLFCDAEGYYIAPSVRNAIKDRGCLTRSFVIAPSPR